MARFTYKLSFEARDYAIAARVVNFVRVALEAGAGVTGIVVQSLDETENLETGSLVPVRTDVQRYWPVTSALRLRRHPSGHGYAPVVHEWGDLCGISLIGLPPAVQIHITDPEHTREELLDADGNSAPLRWCVALYTDDCENVVNFYAADGAVAAEWAILLYDLYF